MEEKKLVYDPSYRTPGEKVIEAISFVLFWGLVALCALSVSSFGWIWGLLLSLVILPVGCSLIGMMKE